METAMRVFAVFGIIWFSFSIVGFIWVLRMLYTSLFCVICEDELTAVDKDEQPR